MEKAVAKYIKEQVETKQALGELNHPARPNVDPERAAIIIEKLWFEGNDVKGRAELLKVIIVMVINWLLILELVGFRGVSSRGLGSLKASGTGHNIVQEDFVLTVGVDVVWGPSAPNAYVESSRRVAESVDTINENFESKISLMDALKGIINT